MQPSNLSKREGDLCRFHSLIPDQKFCFNYMFSSIRISHLFSLILKKAWNCLSRYRFGIWSHHWFSEYKGFVRILKVLWNKVVSEKAASGLIGCSWLQHSAEHMAFVKASQKLLLTLSSLFSRPLNSYWSGIEHCRDPINNFWHLDSIGRRGDHSRHKRFFFCEAVPELIKLSWDKHLGNFVNKDNLVSQWEKP